MHFLVVSLRYWKDNPEGSTLHYQKTDRHITKKTPIMVQPVGSRVEFGRLAAFLLLQCDGHHQTIETLKANEASNSTLAIPGPSRTLLKISMFATKRHQATKIWCISYNQEGETRSGSNVAVNRQRGALESSSLESMEAYCASFVVRISSADTSSSIAGMPSMLRRTMATTLKIDRALKKVVALLGTKVFERRDHLVCETGIRPAKREGSKYNSYIGEKPFHPFQYSVGPITE
ncbi:uncharacterized protein BT62DRAFT_923588 [Guyanagaster necrorhizus]|uniref:Uncharacterized protein n=1 Tax=Guyanagaster necrorhizus TaxID=856835 RepID=A0A9P7VI72_9AGAR|nr:uncharacterized protein BT62DRAFT_923588 [Guyanagaster necrorhizus MCA 3950]KAG7440997.1 hypothetical protein BT62DRAFT_923588 [Guyanagaster necrorhizus MCA 3950]